jgi:hypothetical protein
MIGAPLGRRQAADAIKIFALSVLYKAELKPEKIKGKAPVIGEVGGKLKVDAEVSANCRRAAGRELGAGL